MDEDNQLIVFTCAGGHKTFVAVAGYDREGAEELARILDGTADIYIADERSDPKSPIAHCGICGDVLTASVSDTHLVEGTA